MSFDSFQIITVKQDHTKKCINTASGARRICVLKSCCRGGKMHGKKRKKGFPAKIRVKKRQSPAMHDHDQVTI